MKKSELKSGMVVEDKRGRRGIVLIGTTLGDIIGGLGNPGGDRSTWGKLSKYADDLTSSFGKDYDIVKVFNPDNNMSYGSVEDLHLIMIWKRVKTVELTMDEIAKKFGVDVNNLKIKK